MAVHVCPMLGVSDATSAYRFYMILVQYKCLGVKLMFECLVLKLKRGILGERKSQEYP